MENFTTPNISLAAALHTMDHKLLHIEKSPSGLASFAFEQTDELEEDRKSFWSGELVVDAKSVLDSQRELFERMRQT